MTEFKLKFEDIVSKIEEFTSLHYNKNWKVMAGFHFIRGTNTLQSELQDKFTMPGVCILHKTRFETKFIPIAYVFPDIRWNNLDLKQFININNSKTVSKKGFFKRSE